MARQAHATKRGPGRRHKDGTYRNGKPKKSGFAAGVCNAAARKRAESRLHLNKHPLRDKHGAFTRTGAQPCEPWQGQERRKWLAGISALRGF